ncbi:hypothetical protein D9623_33455 (plasmid) [Azospirillum brasilense]|uniref:Uncharacterized protein n=1 Tax=Azospirillum brasilense TaxID=192 RepID=A0A4D8QW54_AZOBR|nr:MULTISPECIES: hypothetical protein [Azospirillum]YP_001686908.1 hypothetical protein APCd_gp67 [Azospirillum phage Cd]MDW7555344.1 hypothetical protein [Azospirillum brasilense]MDW7595248.1 hypothetical protein [Azospirillum brasilense]MDW7630402.1 hypothetical protein [Azospirillum brasilense]MDX5949769.1 hypothetical protein [Azospirillum brasilense]OPH16895.1 hypothetical protein FE89_02760 [Azospirillum brasilense]
MTKAKAEIQTTNATFHVWQMTEAESAAPIEFHMQITGQGMRGVSLDAEQAEAVGEALIAAAKAARKKARRTVQPFAA